MNRNVIIGIIVFIIIIGGLLLFSRGKAPSAVKTGVISEEEDGLATFGSELDLFAGDEIVLDEINQALVDVAEITEAVSAAEAIDSASISQEANQADLSNDITSFNNDEAQLQELDQAFSEVSQ